MKLPMIIIGGGGHSKVLIDTLKLQSETILGAVDSNPLLHGKTILGVQIQGAEEWISKYSPSQIRLVNGIGSTGVPHSRHQVFELFKNQGYSFASVIHPSSVISKEVELGEGVQVMAGTILQPGVRIGSNTIINTRSSIDHDCHIGTDVHIAPGVTLSGSVEIGEMTHVGTGATVIQGIRIGKRCVIAAGAVVIRDIPNGALVAGVPASIR